MLAAILASADPGRLQVGLSLLVSTAVEDEEARGLLSFGSLEALASGAPPGDVAELWATAAELPACRLWACAAAAQASGVAIVPPLEGVMSTPRFLRETAGARLVVV